MTMIIRTVRIVLRPQLEAAFMSHVRGVIAATMGNVDGLLDLRMGLRNDGRSTVALGVSVWRDVDAARAFFGADWNRAVMWDPHGEWATDSTVEHFEQVDVTERV
jgi:hypothetical protein